MDIVARVKSDLAEQKYKSVNVPLGKPVLVDPVLRSKKFGIPTKSSESVKAVMNLAHLSNDTEEVRQLYLKSHNAYGVGEKVIFLNFLIFFLNFLFLRLTENMRILNQLPFLAKRHHMINLAEECGKLW